MTTIKFRRDTSANWTSVNPIPAQGEPCYETDTHKFKIGDGVTKYTNLPYQGGGDSGGGATINDNTTTTTSVWSSSKTNTEITTAVDTINSTKNDNIFDIGKFTVVGNPTITNDGIASGFSAGNYLTSGNTYDIDLSLDKNITIKGDNIFYTSIQDSIGLFQLQYENGGRININQNWSQYIVYMNDGTNTLTFTTDLVSNSNIRNAFTFEIDNNTATIKGVEYRANGTIYTKTKSVDISGIDKTKFGKARVLIGTATWAGTNIKSLDLKQFSITVDGKEVFNGLMNSTKPIYDAIKDNNTKLSEFKTETSTDFSAVNSALNEKANLTDLALKQNLLVSGTNIKTINGETILGEGDITVGGSTPANMVTTDTTQTISGSKTFTNGITTASIYPTDEITFNSTSQSRYINNIDTISGGYRSQNGYITFKGDTTLVGDNKLVLNGRAGGLKLTADSTADITCENDLIAPNIRTTANGTIKLAHPMDNASGLITLSNNYGQLSISSSLGGTNNLLGVTRDTAYALIDGDNIITKDKDGNLHYYINSQNIDTTYMKWDNSTGKLKVDTAAVAHLAMPSTRQVDLTLGASGATYTAPADGWVVILANKAQGLRIEDILFAQAPDNDNFSGLNLPIPKNQNFSIFYNTIDMSQPWTRFRFIYTVGTALTNTEPDIG